MKKRLFKRAIAWLLIGVLMLLALPAAAEGEKTPIHRYVGVSETEITTPELGKPVVSQIHFETKEGAPLTINSTMNGWQREQYPGVFWSYFGDYFEEGVYRYWFQLRCDDPAFGIPSDITASVNGKELILNKGIAYFSDGLAYVVDFYSEVFEIKIPEGTPVTPFPGLDVSVPESFVGADLSSFSVDGLFYGGSRPYKYELKSGPSWIKVDENGAVSGRPEKAGKNEQLTVTATDAAGAAATVTLNVGETYPNLEDRKPIPTVKLTSDGTAGEVYIGSPVFLPKLTVTEGAPAEIGDVFWIKLDKDGGDFYTSDVFTEGEYLLVIDLRVPNHTEQLTEKTETFLDGKKLINDGGFDDESFFSVAVFVCDTVTAKEGTPPVITEPVTSPVTSPETSGTTAPETTQKASDSKDDETTANAPDTTAPEVTTESDSVEKIGKGLPTGAVIAIVVLSVAVVGLAAALSVVLIRRKK